LSNSEHSVLPPAWISSAKNLFSTWSFMFFQLFKAILLASDTNDSVVCFQSASHHQHYVHSIADRCNSSIC